MAEAWPPTYVSTPTGLILPARLAEDRYTKKVPKAVDLFAGCGGFSCGLMEAGFHVVAALELDPLAALTYTINLCRQPVHMHFQTNELEDKFEVLIEDSYSKTGRFPTAGSAFISSRPELHSGDDHIFMWDARDITGDFILETLGMDVGDLDLVCGSPPCQGFSTAGKQDPKDPRNDLTLEFARLIVELQPKSMVMENVPGILDATTATGEPVMDAIKEVLTRGTFSYRKALNKMMALQGDGLTLHRTGAEKQKPKKPRTERDESQLSLI